MVDPEILATAVLLARKFGARRLVLFGSALERPEEARDLDLGCEGVEGWTFFELLGFLQEALPVPVDLVDLGSDDPIVPLIRARSRVLYAA